MSEAGHAYELPADQTALADTIREAVDGEVVYLTRRMRTAIEALSGQPARQAR